MNKLARPQKEGLDYFSLDVSLDDKFKLIIAEFGLEGLGIIVALLQKIYENGYYYCWNDDALLLYSLHNNTDKTRVNTVITRCIERGIFNKELFDKYSILTSNGIQKRYLKVCKESRRKRVPFINEYLLCNDDELTKVITELTSLNPEFSTQSKVKKSKEKKSKEKNIAKDKNLEKEFQETYLEDLKKACEEIFNKWTLCKGLISHKKLTAEMKKQIKTIISKEKQTNKIKHNIVDQEKVKEIIQAIERVDKAITDDTYFYSNKWALDKFLKQSNGWQNWTDEGQYWNNYLSEKNNNNNKGKKDFSSKKPNAFNDYEQRATKYSNSELEKMLGVK